MNRYLAHAIAAASTVLFLAGLSIGLALGLRWAEGQGPRGGLIGWNSLVEIAIWVLLLIAPAVALVRNQRAFLPVAAVLSLGVAGVALVRYRSPFWALADGLGFALGLLFFRFILSVCTAAPKDASPRGRGAA